MTWNSTVEVWTTGELVTQTKATTEWTDRFNAIGDPWTAYTSTWAAATTNPTLGSTVVVGEFSQQDKLVKGSIEITIAAGFAAGSGVYTLTLPVAAKSSIVIGSALFFDSSTSTYYPGIGYRTSAVSTEMSLVFQTARWAAAAPVAPALNDVISVSFQYQAA